MLIPVQSTAKNKPKQNVCKQTGTTAFSVLLNASQHNRRKHFQVTVAPLIATHLEAAVATI